jgi:hypothetical protein
MTTLAVLTMMATCGLYLWSRFDDDRERRDAWRNGESGA